MSAYNQGHAKMAVCVCAGIAVIVFVACFSFYLVQNAWSIANAKDTVVEQHALIAKIQACEQLPASQRLLCINPPQSPGAEYRADARQCDNSASDDSGPTWKECMLALEARQ